MNFAEKIDYTLLRATATKNDVKKLCSEAKKAHFASVCVNPLFVSFAQSELQNSSVKVCTVIAFPLGIDTIDNKAASAAVAVDEGADEIDFVQNLAFVKEQNWDDLLEEFCAIRASVDSVQTQENKKIIVKAILETCFLSDEEIEKCCEIAKKAELDFVKTSTGFAILKDEKGNLLPNGATVHAVSLMKKCVGNELGVKASGAIRTKEDVQKMLDAGADRIGTSAFLV